MLSDHERETLREIQRHLTVEDPEFEKSFRAVDVPKYRWVYTTLVVITVVLAPVMLLVGSTGGTVAFTVVGGTLWWTRRLEYGTSQRKSGE